MQPNKSPSAIPMLCFRCFSAVWITVLAIGCALGLSACDTANDPPREQTDAWEPFTDGLPRVAAHALARDEDGTVYVGTASTVDRGGLFASTDDGASWAPVDPQPAFAQGQGIGTGIDAVATLNGSVFVANRDVPRQAAFRPAGATEWRGAASGLTADATVLTMRVHRGTLFAGTSDGLYRWTDDRWARVPFPVPYLSALASDGERLYVAARETVGPGAVYASPNAASSTPEWSSVTRDLDVREDGSVAAVHAHNGALYVVYIEAFAAMQPNVIYRRASGSAAWDAVYRVPAGSITSFHSTERGLYAGTTESGVLFSAEGLAWSVQDAGLRQDSRFVFDLVSAGDRVVAGTFNGTYRASAASATPQWTEAVEGLPVGAFAYGYAMRADDRGLLLGLTGQGAMRSRRDAAVWRFASEGLAADATIRSFASFNGALYAGVTLGITGTLAGDAAAVWRSTDDGDTWTLSTGGTLRSNAQVWDVAASDAHMCAGTVQQGVFCSTNGTDWSTFSSGLPRRDDGTGYEDVRSVDLLDGALLAGADGPRVWRLPEGATTWTASLLSDDVRVTYDLAHTGENVVYAGTNRGVFRSTDAGETWEPFSDGLPTVLGRPLHTEVLVAAEGVLFAGTRGEGVFRLDPGATTWKAVGPVSSASSSTQPGIIDTVPVSAMAVTPNAIFVSLRDDGVYRRKR